ncbi:MAG TPA: hypothetical protein DEP72_01325 [Clostridiales bacterium]|nr:MAG: hypothetical protein A2Y18_05660 [Clostridiales bacterium GWD2_32_19]HCC06794.1 hypothetical protein [Clostridiales bacterium]
MTKKELSASNEHTFVEEDSITVGDVMKQEVVAVGNKKEKSELVIVKREFTEGGKPLEIKLNDIVNVVLLKKIV